MSFFRIKYWKTVKHTICGMGDCYKVITTFKTTEAANDFVKNILCKKQPVEDWNEKVVNEIKCGD